MKIPYKTIGFLFYTLLIAVAVWIGFQKCTSSTFEEVVIKEVVTHDTAWKYIIVDSTKLVPVKETIYLDTTKFDTAAVLKNYFTERDYVFNFSDSNYVFNQKLTLFKNELKFNKFEIGVISKNTYREVTNHVPYDYQLFLGGGFFIPFSGKLDFKVHGSLIYKKNQFGIGYQFVNRGILIDYKYSIWSK